MGKLRHEHPGTQSTLPQGGRNAGGTGKEVQAQPFLKL